MFLFKEVEQLVVYQLLPNLTTWENFGGEPVSM